MNPPFSKPSIADRAFEYLRTCLQSGELGGDGPFTQRCHALLREYYGVPVLLTHSCTGALDMAAILTNVGAGDEVIMPSYTFSSTANAFVLRGATPVFVDIRQDTLNLDEQLVHEAITSRTKAIVAVHYAGVSCEMDSICQTATAHGLFVVEDAAQGYGSTYHGRALGTLGHLGALSFHVTKNVISGEGGALLVNDQKLTERAYIIREKGTNRAQFASHKVDKYEWLDLGSSYLPSDLIAALLLAQMEQADLVNQRRLEIWNKYQSAFATAEVCGRLTRPHVPVHCGHNGHIYYLLLPDARIAEHFRERLAQADVPSPHHYVPLHSAPAGRRFGRTATAMTVTDRVANTLVRLPIHAELCEADIERVIATVLEAVR